MKQCFRRAAMAVTICIAVASLSSTASAGDLTDWKKAIVESQVFLANAEPEKAEAMLLWLERDQPEVRNEPLFCYQRFFVALEGRGDRATAKLMLRRLDHLVDAGSLAADSPIYHSVTQAWHRALSYTDSDLRRRANRIMTERLKRNAENSQ